MSARTPRRGWRRLRHRLRPLWTRPWARLARATLPSLYRAYMRLVFATSRVEIGDFSARVQSVCDAHDGVVVMLWHEEVFSVAYGYGVHAGLRVHTLASAGDAGEVIARILERCGFEVFRGGSTTHRSRRRPAVLLAMVRHMQETPRVIYGLTVDGSKGPAWRMKPGALLIAAKTGRPVMLARTWYARCGRLPTWDRTAIPLPFNRIRYFLRGPYHVGDAARDPATRERLLEALEAQLVDLAAESHAALGQPRPPGLRTRADARREREGGAAGGPAADAI